MLTRICAAAAALALSALAGCAAPSDSADQAELSACTRNADAVYQMSNQNGLARTGQNGLYFAPMPDHAFDAQRMGTLDARNNQVRDCMENGNSDAALPNSAPLPAPRVVGTGNP